MTSRLKGTPVFALAVLIATGAQASSAPPSLFFTPQETREATRLARQLIPQGKGDLYLGAVMFYAPDDWAVWLQGEKWTPETTRDDLQILKVTAEEVRVAWRENAGEEAREITLKPNQSYERTTGKIIAR